MLRKMGVGIIGVGFIGERHAKTMYELECADLVAVADINTNRSKEIASKYGSEPYTNYEDLLKRDDIEAVVICTPENLHLNPVISASEAGKHVLLEKPIANDSNIGHQIINTTKKSGIRFMVTHVLRYAPTFVHINQLIKDNKIGDIVYLYIRHNSTIDRPKRLKGRTSVIFFLGVHDVDFMRRNVGDVEYVYADGIKKILKNIDAEDVVFSSLKFKNGKLGVIENSWINPMSFNRQPDISIMITGTNGLIEYSMEKGLILWEKNSYSILTSEVQHGKPLDSFAIQDEHFIKSIWNGTEFRTTGEDALAAVKICEAIHESLNNGKRILMRVR